VKVVRLKMTSEGRVCLGLADVKRYILGAVPRRSSDVLCSSGLPGP